MFVGKKKYRWNENHIVQKNKANVLCMWMACFVERQESTGLESLLGCQGGSESSAAVLAG